MKNAAPARVRPNLATTCRARFPYGHSYNIFILFSCQEKWEKSSVLFLLTEQSLLCTINLTMTKDLNFRGEKK